MNKSVEEEVDAQINWMKSLIDGSKAAEPAPKPKPHFDSEIDILLANIGVTDTESVQKTNGNYELDTNLDIHTSFAPSPLTEKSEPQYRISDPLDSEFSDEEDYSDPDDYNIDDSTTVRGKEIPSWARAANLIVELERQKTIDPDLIFVGFEKSCDLGSMFEKKKKTFKIRGDSGWWGADSVTAEEEIKYKKALGYV